MLVVLPWLTGGVDLHPHGEPLGGGALRAGETYAPAAVHPDLPHHFEAGTSAERPVCLLCLFQAAASGGHLTVLPGQVPDLSSAGLELLDLPRAESRHVRPRTSRGPPAIAPLA